MREKSNSKRISSRPCHTDCAASLSACWSSAIDYGVRSLRALARFARRFRDLMSGLMKQLSKIRAEAAECNLVANLATDPEKKQMYTRLAEHLTSLASEVERAVREGKPAD
jgi:hypothetical protein